VQNPTGDKSDLPRKSFKDDKESPKLGTIRKNATCQGAKSRFSVPFFELRRLIRSEHMTAENVKQS
jgi:hypothetical protein